MFYANHFEDPELCDYLLKDDDKGILVKRYYYLESLNWMEPIKISLKDPKDRDKWGKWLPFPGQLWTGSWGKYGGFTSVMSLAVDAHRSVLSNEIVVESDYPEYEDNWKAAKIIGSILEDKGFIPHYYYSGSKSIHIHIFLDWNMMKDVDPIISELLKVKYHSSKLRFKKAFILWLREKMISCWDTGAREFDENLVRATHLIRTELSRNKKGFKTFMGYTYKDLSFVAPICNENNGFYPKLGKLRLSRPKDTPQIIEEFYNNIIINDNARKAKKRNTSLSRWLDKGTEGCRSCVKALLDDSFKEYNDGYKRAMFIIINELRKVYGEEEAIAKINDWNERMGNPIRQQEIDYRFTTAEYKLPCPYIHKFLKEMGVEHNCKR